MPCVDQMSSARSTTVYRCVVCRLHAAVLWLLCWWLDRFAVLAWWQLDCQWCMRHGLLLAGIRLLSLAGLDIDRDCLVPHCIMISRDQWEFPSFLRPQWQSLCTALTAGKCLPLGLCKGTVKESICWHIPRWHYLCHQLIIQSTSSVHYTALLECAVSSRWPAAS